MALPRASLALSLALIVIACGSSGSPGASDDGGTQDGGDGGPPPGDGALPPDDGATSEGGACGAAACADHPEVCGAFVDACKNVVYCGVCKYDSELVASVSSRGPIGLVIGASTVVAYEHQLATRGAGTWTSAPFTTSTSTIYALSVALAGDGTPWVAYADDTALNVAHLDAGAWTAEPLPSHAQYTSVALAFAGDGTPWALYPGAVAGGGFSIVLAHRASGAWQTTTVTKTAAEVQNVALAVVGQDLQIVWHDPTQGVMFAHGDGSGAFTPEAVDATASGSEADGTKIGYGVDQLGIAVTGAGDVHVAYRTDNVMHAARTNGVWSHEKVPRVSFFSTFDNGPLRIAASKTGAVAIGTLGETIAILGLAGGTWREQPIVPRCDKLDDRLELAFDATGALAIAHTCRGQISFLVQHGTYPADYEAACSQILDGLCAQACTCPKDQTSKCCINQSGSICVDPAPNCQAELLADRPPCANATLDPSVVYGCRDALAQTTQPTCELPDAGKPGMIVPTACAPLF
jgi:hypothetical protein